MRWTPLNWSKRLTLFGITLLFGAVATAEDFQFFGSSIDYWNEVGSKQAVGAKAPAATAKPGTSTKEAPASLPNAGWFPWQQYLDPKNKEFFREGDYTPPEPFMEIVRNPSDANLKLWFEYISRKN